MAEIKERYVTIPKIGLFTSRSTQQLTDRHHLLRKELGDKASIWGTQGAVGSPATSVSLDVNPLNPAIT